MLANDVLHTIGNTPHIRINRLFGSTHSVYIKSECANPGGSIKDRIAVSMVEAAEASGALKPGATIVEPTSGNTGVGLAMVGAVKGYKVVLVMPDSMSVERRRLMLAYGARFELTTHLPHSAIGGMARLNLSTTASSSMVTGAGKSQRICPTVPSKYRLTAITAAPATISSGESGWTACSPSNSTSCSAICSRPLPVRFGLALPR